MAERKGGRGWGEIRAETAEGRALVQLLRDMLEQAGKQLRDLEQPTGYGKSAIQEFVSGKKVPPWAFVERAVGALAAPREREVRRRAAKQVWERAHNPQTPAPIPVPVSETTIALANVAATAQDQAARAQEQLDRAHERNESLAQERDRAQHMVVALSALTADLQRQVAALNDRPDQDTEQKLAELTEQLDAAQRELQRARASRNEAELLTQRLRRRSDDLEEQLAKLRQNASATPLANPAGRPSLPEELQEALFHADVDQVLRTAQSFLDEGQAMRDEVRDEWGITRPVRSTAVERWRTASYLLGRALGSLAMMTGAVAHLAVTDAGAGGWTFPLDLLVLAGLVLVADPWEPAAGLWPTLRSAIRREPLAGPIRVSAQGAADRLVRCLLAGLAAAGAVLCLAAMTRWSTWWLLPLIPATVTCVGYVVAGDRRVLTLLQEAFGQLAAELKTPRPQQPVSVPAGSQQVMALTDPDWLDARRKELGDALAGGWKDAVLWVKAAAAIPATLLGLAVVGVLSSAFIDSSVAHAVTTSWNGSGLVAAIDDPVHSYLAGHTVGLPIAADTAHLVWVASGGGLLLLSFVTGTFGARLTWVLWGAATVAMVWIGTTGPARQVAATLALLGWGITSILALRGLGRRSVAMNNNVTINNSDD